MQQTAATLSNPQKPLKVLVFVPKLTLEGGIANYYRMLKDFLPGEYRIFEKSQAKTLPGKLLATGWDLLRYTMLLLFGNYKIVCLNPSLKPLVVKREAVYAFIAKKIFHKKLVVFWHGWEFDYAERLEKEHLAWFKKRYFDAEKMLVLISSVCDKLRAWGYKGKVVQVTTCFEESFTELKVSYNTQKPFKVLFMARVEIIKGVIIALEALKIFRNKSDIPLELTIAGNGGGLTEAKEFARANGLDDVKFPGYVRGAEKITYLLENDIFLQPTYHPEGLPCAMLEAMACGLAVVTSNAGGIPDFFINGNMGFMLDTLDPEAYADKLLELVSQPEKIRQCGEYNRNYVLDRFAASKVAARECAEIQDI